MKYRLRLECRGAQIFEVAGDDDCLSLRTAWCALLDEILAVPVAVRQEGTLKIQLVLDGVNVTRW
jgi:hypothetical protein